MRNTDDLQDKEPFRPFGPKVTPEPAPAPAPKQIAPNIVQDTDGRLHTVPTPFPTIHPEMLPWI